jgi:hypothetical protein
VEGHAWTPHRPHTLQHIPLHASTPKLGASRIIPPVALPLSPRWLRLDPLRKLGRFAQDGNALSRTEMAADSRERYPAIVESIYLACVSPTSYLNAGWNMPCESLWQYSTYCTLSRSPRASDRYQRWYAPCVQAMIFPSKHAGCGMSTADAEDGPTPTPLLMETKSDACVGTTAAPLW